MKSLEKVKKDFGLAIKRARAGKDHWPTELKEDVGTIYNSKKYSSAEIATALNLFPAQVTTWGRRVKGKPTHLSSKWPKEIDSKKEKGNLLESIMSEIDNPIEKEKLDAIHTKCGRIENDFWEALDEKDTSLKDLRSYAAGLLKEVINIADFIEDKIDKL